MFCIDFEDDDLVGAAGADHPWVFNDGVDIVPYAAAGCPQGDRCGYFDEGRLEIPHFSNMYSSFSSLRITFDYRRTAGGVYHQGIISNDCFNGQAGESGNSLLFACLSHVVAGALREPFIFVQTVSTYLPSYAFIC